MNEWHYANCGEGSEKRIYDEAVEALRRAVCRLQRYSFLLDSKGNVRRVPDKTGAWVEFHELHALFDTDAIDAFIAAERAKFAIDAARAATSGSEGEGRG